VSGTHLGPATNFSSSKFSLERVSNLLFLLVLSSAVLLGSESRGTQDHILLSQFLRLPQPGGPGLRIYISREQGGPDIPPGTRFPFCRLLRLAGLRWRYSILPPHEKATRVQVQLQVTLRHGQLASSSWCHTPFGAGDQMLHFFERQLLFYVFM
jgi:hypothetical protein